MVRSTIGKKELHTEKMQPKTIEEHYEAILEDDSPIDSEYTKLTPDDLPDWFDEDLFKKGQEYFSRNHLAINAAHISGLIAVFLIPSVTKILVFTRQSSIPCSAFKRYFQTFIHTCNLYDHDVKNPDSDFYKTINAIRWMHATTSKRAGCCINTQITQRDMVLTQYGFVSYTLTNPEALGLTNEIDGREGYNHLWRVVGHLLGIPDRLNVCRINQQETTLLCEKLRDEICVKAMKEPTEEFYHLTETSINGLKSFDPTLDTDAFLKIFYELHKIEYEKNIGFYSKCMYYFRRSIFYSFGSPLIGWFVRPLWNGYLRFVVKIFRKYPIIAWLHYGRKKSQIILYPQLRARDPSDNHMME